MSDWELRSPPADVAARWRRDGHWTDETLGQLLDAGLAADPDLAVKFRSATRPWTGTYASIRDLARRVATGLAAVGVRPGDTVAFQLPNWVEAAATFYATAFLGAAVVPIVHFYGAKEVGYILRHTGVRTFVTADRFGHLDHLAALESMRDDLPQLERVFVVGDGPVPSWARPFSALADGHEPIGAPAATDPDSPALVAYTSGTTADPKGVVHTHRTIGFEVRQLAAVQPEHAPPPLVGAPVGHAIGMLGALLLPVHNGVPIHLIDVWDPAKVLRAMTEDRLLSGTGAPYFLLSLLDHPDCTDEHLELMRWIGLGGAAVAPAVSDRAEALGISTVRMYGSTEHPSITGSTHDAPADKRKYTDGRPLPGVELRLADEDDEILSRGPDCFAGYTDPALTARVLDADGWYHTGDIGRLDDDGYVTIVDRKSDVIIRGGENISALEVEEQLLRIPGIAEAAVVAAPDDRMGERACAFVRTSPGAAPTLAAVRQHLERAGLARQKWPEDLRVVDDLPRTPSGKVKKFVLRQQLRDGGQVR